jgi:hypothetical protein
MPKKQVYLVVLAALVGGICLYVNRDWFSRRPIQITHRFHAFGGRFDRAGVAPLMFEFNCRLKLTSIKVVSASEGTNKKPAHALWQLVSESNSVPTRGFLYGMNVPGMRPVYKGTVAEPLDPSQKYRILIEAGSAKAQHDFDLNP